MELLGLILPIVNNGMLLWSEERRTRFMKKHGHLLQELQDAKNTSSEDYTDDDLMLAEQRLRVFLQAYGSELERHALEALSGKD